MKDRSIGLRSSLGQVRTLRYTVAYYYSYTSLRQGSSGAISRRYLPLRDCLNSGRLTVQCRVNTGAISNPQLQQVSLLHRTRLSY